MYYYSNINACRLYLIWPICDIWTPKLSGNQILTKYNLTRCINTGICFEYIITYLSGSGRNSQGKIYNKVLCNAAELCLINEIPDADNFKQRLYVRNIATLHSLGFNVRSILLMLNTLKILKPQRILKWEWISVIWNNVYRLHFMYTPIH